jgi:hypothetical protein
MFPKLLHGTETETVEIIYFLSDDQLSSEKSQV